MRPRKFLGILRTFGQFEGKTDTLSYATMKQLSVDECEEARAHCGSRSPIAKVNMRVLNDRATIGSDRLEMNVGR